MVLSDGDILERLSFPDDDPNRLRISPFVGYDDPDHVQSGKISYGLTSAGYDVRVSNVYKVFTNICSGHVDPKEFDPKSFEDHVGDTCIVPPNSFALGVSVETVRIPRDVIATCVGKSTYARSGIIVSVTPLEPEWEGQITVEISNTTPRPAVIYSMEGIMQVLFYRTLATCICSYADKRGRYQGQRGITLPFVRGTS